MPGNKTWMNLANFLIEKKFAKPVLWLGDDRHKNYVEYSFPGSYYSLNDFKFFPEKYISKFQIDEDFILTDDYLRLKDKSIKMMDRIDEAQLFTRVDREAVFNLSLFWAMTRVTSLKPDFLLMVEAPHSYIHLIIYEYCRYKKIRSFNFIGNALAPFVFFKDATNGNLFSNSQRISELDKAIIEHLENRFNDISRNSSDYLAKHLSKALSEQTSFHRIAEDFKIDSRKFLKEFIFGSSSILNTHRINSFKRTRFWYNRKKQLVNSFENSIDHSISLDRKFVYFAMHYEPERSTLPDGGEYHDQLKALSCLRKFVPLDIPIYVKEHPATFIKNRRGHLGRSLLIYGIIESIENVKIVSSVFNTKELIDNSIFTATITGTAALEAALREKIGLIFGESWFDGIPNVMSYNIKLKYDQIEKTKIIPNGDIRSAIIEKFNKKGFYAVQNLTGQKRFEYDSSPSESYFFNSVYKILKQQNYEMSDM